MKNEEDYDITVNSLIIKNFWKFSCLMQGRADTQVLMI